jgi:hypothetical protein
MPGNAVLCVGILWGSSLASQLCGESVGTPQGLHPPESISSRHGLRPENGIATEAGGLPAPFAWHGLKPDLFDAPPATTALRARLTTRG